MVEIWKDVVGYEGLYQVSNMGQVKSFNYRGHGNTMILKIYKDRYGYYYVKLFKNGKLKSYKVHRLVGIAFIPNTENKPQINHIDGEKTNNIVDNLEWSTNKENIQHANKTGLINAKGEKHYKSKLKEFQVLEIRDKYATGKYFQHDLAYEYNIHKSVISGIILRKIWKHI